MSERAPFFSVIVPTHNAEGYIRKGLDSIRSQVFTDYELIVVCDRCTDGTAEIAREYTDRVIEVNYGRTGPSRNAGLDAARGEWVLFMDDDDWFLHEYVFDQLAATVGENGEDILAFSFIFKGKGYAANVPGHLFIAVWNKCWRRSFIGDTRFPDWDMGEDDVGFTRILHPKAKITYWDMPMYYYNYLREGSITWDLKKRGLR